MTMQSITTSSPARLGSMLLIAKNPGIKTGEIAQRGGWSVFHIRNCLRYLRKKGRVRSRRPVSNGECQWWIGKQVEPVQSTKPRKVKPAPVVVRGVNSVFALGAQ